MAQGKINSYPHLKTVEKQGMNWTSNYCMERFGPTALQSREHGSEAVSVGIGARGDS